VTSNQPESVNHGDPAPDWEITGPMALRLRAERLNGDARIYTIETTCRDASRNASTGSASVLVPRNP